MQVPAYNKESVPSMYHQLGKAAPSEEVVSLRTAVDAALAAHAPALTIGVDSVASLDAAVLGGLIAGLRRLRDIGSTVRLHATRPDLLRTLEVTGLDRVFDVSATAPKAEPEDAPPAAPPKARRIVAAMLGLLTALATTTMPGFAQGTELTPEQIVSKLAERNPSLSSFQAHVDVRLHTGIPFLNPTLEGTTYFKRPSNYEVVFTKVPPYAKGIDKLYSDIGDPSAWEKRFTMALAGDTFINGRRDLVLRLVQRVRGMIDHEDVAIDPQSWTIDKMTYYYYNGGTISLSQTFRYEGEYSVLSDQHADVALPHVPRVVGTAHYSAYHMNVAIDESVFTAKATKELGTK